jgi:hypothetical protein
MKPTDLNAFMNDLNAGIFAQQVANALSEVGAAVVNFSKKGQIKLTFDISQIAESSQVKITHKLEYAMPTRRGSKREDSALDTPMYVTPKGITLFNEDPMAQLFSREQSPASSREI